MWRGPHFLSSYILAGEGNVLDTFEKKTVSPWLVWLSGLSAGLRTSRKVAGSIPGEGTCLGCRPGPQLGVCKRQPIVSLTH